MRNSLFSPVRINRLTVKNRTVRSATHEALAAENGLYTPELIDHLGMLADGDVGLIVSGHAFVSPDGRAGRRQAAAGRDECVHYWRPAVERVRKSGGKLVLQIAHAGGYAMDPELAAAPTSFQASAGRPPCRELSVDRIYELIENFIDAAVRAEAADFDGVQIHAAHGYLISQFLSSYYNRRSDAFGGTLENRARFLMLVLEGIRGAVDPEFPVLIKLNSEDFIEGGFTSDECVEVCRMLEERGIDAIELSGGVPESRPELLPVRAVNGPPYYARTARRVKDAVDVPVILVGGIRFPEEAEQLITDGVCDLVSFSRPLIREPGLIRRWQSGDHRSATCSRCNACFRPILTAKSFGCPRLRTQEG